MLKYEWVRSLKVITIKQPFATLIAKGLKQYEFRTWKTKYRGELLIHAGKTIDKKAMERYKNFSFEYPTSCIIAKVDLTNCVLIDETMKNKLRKENETIYYGVLQDENWHGYGFQLENVREMDPIYIKGKLGLWNYEGEINEKS